MELGFLGLGRMGFNMVRRLRLEDHRVVAWNRTYAKTEEVTQYGAEGAKTIEETDPDARTPPHRLDHGAEWTDHRGPD